MLRMYPISELLFFTWKVPQCSLSGTTDHGLLLKDSLINRCGTQKWQIVTRHLRKDHLEITRCDVLPAMLDIDEESIYKVPSTLIP